MMAVVFDDLEKFVCQRLAATLGVADAFVSNRIDAAAHEHELRVIVRDESSTSSLITSQHRVSVRVSHPVMDTASQAARRVSGLLQLLPGDAVGNPVAAVGAIYGPYRVTSDDPTRTEYYVSAEITQIGRNFEIN